MQYADWHNNCGLDWIAIPVPPAVQPHLPQQHHRLRHGLTALRKPAGLPMAPLLCLGTLPLYRIGCCPCFLSPEQLAYIAQASFPQAQAFFTSFGVSVPVGFEITFVSYIIIIVGIANLAPQPPHQDFVPPAHTAQKARFVDAVHLASDTPGPQGSQRPHLFGVQNYTSNCLASQSKKTPSLTTSCGISRYFHGLPPYLALNSVAASQYFLPAFAFN